jgi:dienelactone hydrolase
MAPVKEKTLHPEVTVMRLRLAVLLISTMVLAPAWAAVRGQEAEYRAGDTVMKGYLAYDDAASGKRAGVLVVHEWWGLNEHARDIARRLAQAGYVALALDMYGGGRSTEHPEDAGQMAAQLRKNHDLAMRRFRAARDFLAGWPQVDGSRIAAFGYCFGGTVVLEAARSGADLRGVVSFHGGLGTERRARPGDIEAEILVLNGADDPFVPPDQVRAFEQEMRAAGAGYRVINYPGAVHSFTNPAATALGRKFDMPLEYNAEADHKSWAEAQAFLRRVLR